MADMVSYTNPTNLAPVVSSESKDGSCFNTSYQSPNPAGVHDIRSFDSEQLGVRF